MKTIGLLGGMSWESTAVYYRLINEKTKSLRGGLHSAPSVLLSVDFQEIEELQQQGDWEKAALRLSQYAQQIEKAGADFLIICTNTMHKVADSIQKAIDIPLLHIADATANVLISNKIDKVGLLGTRFTMEQAFYVERLKSHGLDVIIPELKDREFIHRTIYEELCLGKIHDSAREKFISIIADLHSQGAKGVIEGCTEISMLVKQRHTQIPLFDTTTIHAEEAVKFALETQPQTHD